MTDIRLCLVYLQKHKKESCKQVISISVHPQKMFTVET